MSRLGFDRATGAFALCLFLAWGCGDDSAGAVRAPDGGLRAPDGGLLAPDGGLLAPDGGTALPAPSAKLLVLSDPHYFDPSLGTTGSAFATAISHDRKLLAESDAIMRAMADA